MTTAAAPFAHIAVLGVGLIGGSLARALKRANEQVTITGYGDREDSLRRAVELGVIDRYLLDLRQAVAAADAVVLAAPPAAVPPLLRRLAGALQPHCVVTDVASVKSPVVAAARAALGEHFPMFVPAHPIAGTEKNGVEASFAQLFEQRTVILTPAAETSPAARDGVAAMWRSTGAAVVELTAEHHDQVLAATSHLPHVLAYALVDCLARMQDRKEIFAYAAGGFADFTRIASSSPEMWRDVCLANPAPILAALDDFEQHLQEVRSAVAAHDGPRLLTIFSRARQARDRFIGTGD